jgi:hypothetical protein
MRYDPFELDDCFTAIIFYSPDWLSFQDIEDFFKKRQKVSSALGNVVTFNDRPLMEEFCLEFGLVFVSEEKSSEDMLKWLSDNCRGGYYPHLTSYGFSSRYVLLVDQAERLQFKLVWG